MCEQVGQAVHHLADIVGSGTQHGSQLGTQRGEEGLDFAGVARLQAGDDRGDDAVTHHLHRGLAHRLAVLRDFLAKQLEHGPRPHANLGGSHRNGDHADQVQAEIHPIEQVDRPVAVVDHRADVCDQVDGREDIRKHGRIARDGFDTIQGQHAPADIHEPAIERLEIGIDVSGMKIVEGRDEDVGRLRLNLSRCGHGEMTFALG
ncbi:hypothetical protein [Burkholderia glumae]|uniref:hypothetical protein n=1 Tax=Burkholderia glumae TaxID=337 RepID=UPI0023DE8541|nr:hypothetical protein [Burkholderia glumae]